MTELYQIWKDFWVWINGLTPKTVVIVCVGGAVIGCLVFANMMLRDIHKNADTTPVMAELAAIRIEARQNDSITRAQFAEQIAGVVGLVDGVDTKVSKVILIVAANSNSDLIRRLVPYLENVATKQDIYSFVLDIQRDQQRRDTVTHSIEAKKKPGR